MERTTVGSLLRTTQAYCGQLCEKETLDYGIVYHNRRFAALPEASQFREVLIEDAARIPEAFEQAEMWFQKRDLFCRRWAPAEGRGTSDLAEFLIRNGFRARRHVAMSLVRWVDLKAPERVRILPARAMRTAYRETFTEGYAPESSTMRELIAEASLERLDDPHLDMVLALWDKRPVGRCGLYIVGDIARVMNVWVSPDFVDRGVEEALLAHVLALAKRLTMRNVLAQIEETDLAGQVRLEKTGFVRDGEIVEFERDLTANAGVAT